jgi:hypothetical protein
MDNPKKLETLCMQDEDKKNHNTIGFGHHYMYMQTNTNNIKQLEVKANRTYFLCGTRKL